MTTLLLGQLEIMTTLLLRPVFASPKWYFPNYVIFNIKATFLIRSLLGGPNGGLNTGFYCTRRTKEYHTNSMYWDR